MPSTPVPQPTPDRPALALATKPDKAAQRREYRKNVLAGARANHIWLNAFSCIRPTDEFLLSLGRAVLSMVDNPDCTHQSESGQLLDLPIPEVVIRVNKS